MSNKQAQFFVTSYMVAGDDCQGAYLVHATSKREANKIVKAFAEDYVRVRSQNKDEYIADMGQDEWDEMMKDHSTDLKEGDAVSLWSGT